MKIKRVNELMTIDVNDITNYKNTLTELSDVLKGYKEKIEGIKGKIDSNKSDSNKSNTTIDDIDSIITLLSKNLSDSWDNNNKLLNRMNELSSEGDKEIY